MKYVINGHNFKHDVQTVSQIFFPNEKFEVISNINNEQITIISSIENNVSIGAIYLNGIQKEKEERQLSTNMQTADLKYFIKITLYEALKKYTHYNPPWGILTGIRPSKKIFYCLDKGMTEKETVEYLNKFYDCSIPKINLASLVAKTEYDIIKNNNPNDFSLYIGVPFCPSKCLYCSFTSYPIDKYNNYVEQYIDCIVKELVFAKEFSKGKKLVSIYIGGGTPTALNEKSLEKLLYKINESLDIKTVKEFTIEAGRPDTLSLEKLKIINKYNATRISVNPQTMNDKTLATIGRKHKGEDFIQAFYEARSSGCKNINTDIIIGLPNETKKDVEYTFERISELSPENITVHTLAVKRASLLKGELETNKGKDSLFKNAALVENMLNFSQKFIKDINMIPYYMYRQKNSIGNLENVGYCKPGFQCVYNVQIMEEKQTILALGPGAVSKKVYMEENRLERVFNVKSIEEYVSRIDEMITRKKINMFP